MDDNADHAQAGPSPVARRRRARPSWFDVYGEPLLLVLACLAIAIAFSVVLRPVETSKSDFFPFWDSGRAYHLGLDLYFGVPLRPDAGYNLNAPAVTILLFAPLAYLPLPVAFVAWTVVNVLACLLASVWIARAVGVPKRWLVIASVICISHGTFLALQFGQPLGPLLLVLTAAWIADRSDRPVTAGVLLGFAIYAKLFLGLFIPYLLWRRAWRTLAAIAGAGVVAGAAGLLLGGVAAYASWFKVLQAISWEAHLANASLLGAVKRMLSVQPEELLITPLADVPAWVRPAWLVLTAIVVGLTSRRIATRPAIDRDWLAIMFLALLVSPLGWVYYAPLAVGPLVACYLKGPRPVRLTILAAYLCLFVPLTPLMNLQAGVLGTLTIKSIYCWGALGFWWSTQQSDDSASRQ